MPFTLHDPSARKVLPSYHSANSTPFREKSHGVKASYFLAGLQLEIKYGDRVVATEGPFSSLILCHIFLGLFPRSGPSPSKTKFFRFLPSHPEDRRKGRLSRCHSPFSSLFRARLGLIRRPMSVKTFPFFFQRVFSRFNSTKRRSRYDSSPRRTFFRSPCMQKADPDFPSELDPQSAPVLLEQSRLQVRTLPSVPPSLSVLAAATFMHRSSPSMKPDLKSRDLF